MAVIWKDGDWGINYESDHDVHCLRHMPCDNREGHCSCDGRCYTCKVDVPDEVIGFFAMVKWER